MTSPGPRSADSADLVWLPDIEAVLTDYLRDQLAVRPDARDVLVATSVPVQRRARMVILRRDGGRRLDLVRDQARIAVRVWAPTDEQAVDLTQLVRALLAAAVGIGPIRAVSENAGPTAVTDPSGQALRYLVLDITARSVTT